jgi:hypothetical protein
MFKVWNIEFQIDREFFTETNIRGKKLETAEDIISSCEAIWFYLTNDWLSYRIPDHDRRSRWEIHPWWSQLVKFRECDKITRSKQIELPTEDAVIPPLIGYLSSYAARKGGTLEDGTIFKELYYQIIKYENRTGKYFNETVDKKKKLLGDDTQ